MESSMPYSSSPLWPFEALKMVIDHYQYPFLQCSSHTEYSSSNSSSHHWHRHLHSLVTLATHTPTLSGFMLTTRGVIEVFVVSLLLGSSLHRWMPALFFCATVLAVSLAPFVLVGPPERKRPFLLKWCHKEVGEQNLGTTDPINSALPLLT
jgi:hypothetical protein